MGTLAGYVLVGWIVYTVYKAFDPVPLALRRLNTMLNPTQDIPNTSAAALRNYLEETEELIQDLGINNRTRVGKAFLAQRDALKAAVAEATDKEVQQTIDQDTTSESSTESNVQKLREATDDGKGREIFMFGNVRLVVGFNPEESRYEVYTLPGKTSTKKPRYVAHSYKNRPTAQAASRHRLKEWSAKKAKRAA